MRKATEEELNSKRNWIITDLIHERYSFDLTTMVFNNKTIIEILDELAYWGLENKITKYENSDTYILDEIYHEDKDCDTWCLTEEEKERFRPLHIKALLFTPLENFAKGGYMSGCFGGTNRKYGVMDYAKMPAEMEDSKNEKASSKINI